MLEERRAGPRGWSRESVGWRKGGGEEGKGGGGAQQVMQGPVGLQGHLGFLPRTRPALEAAGRGRTGPEAVSSGRLLEGAAGSTGRRGPEPAMMTALDQVEAEEGEKADARSAVKAKLT